MPEEKYNTWVAKWQSPQAFVKWGHPTNATILLNKPVETWLADYPTLNQATAIFGIHAVRLFVGSQLGAYLNQNTTANSRMTEEQLQTMCRDILVVMQNYTVGEVMIFFALLRTGMWKTYGTTTQEICDKFRHEFSDYHNNKIDEANALKAEAKRDAHLDKCVTYEEYKKLTKNQNHVLRTTSENQRD